VIITQISLAFSYLYSLALRTKKRAGRGVTSTGANPVVTRILMGQKITTGDLVGITQVSLALYYYYSF
jgi:hypothetical protein